MRAPDMVFELWAMDPIYRASVEVTIGKEIEFPLAGMHSSKTGRYPGGVYMFIGPATGTVYYVGRTVDLGARLNAHARMVAGTAGQRFNDMIIESDIDDPKSGDYGVLVHCWLMSDETERRGTEHSLIAELVPVLNIA